MGQLRQSKNSLSYYCTLMVSQLFSGLESLSANSTVNLPHTSFWSAILVRTAEFLPDCQLYFVYFHTPIFTAVRIIHTFSILCFLPLNCQNYQSLSLYQPSLISLSPYLSPRLPNLSPSFPPANIMSSTLPTNYPKSRSPSTYKHSSQIPTKFKSTRNPSVNVASPAQSKSPSEDKDSLPSNHVIVRMKAGFTATTIKLYSHNTCVPGTFDGKDAFICDD